MKLVVAVRALHSFRKGHGASARAVFGFSSRGRGHIVVVLNFMLLPYVDFISPSKTFGNTTCRPVCCSSHFQHIEQLFRTYGVLLSESANFATQLISRKASMIMDGVTDDKKIIIWPEEKKTAVQIRLAEYNTLRSEILIRLQIQHQVIGFLLTLIAATIAVAVTVALADKTKVNIATQDTILNWGFLLLPVIVAPLWFMFFDHELMIWGAGGGIYELRAHTKELMPENEDWFDDRRIAHLALFSRWTHYAVSNGRFMLFIIPTFVPVWYFGLCNQHWLKIHPYCWLVLWTDVLIALLLLLASASSLWQQRRWRHVPSAKSTQKTIS